MVVGLLIIVFAFTVVLVGVPHEATETLYYDVDFQNLYESDEADEQDKGNNEEEEEEEEEEEQVKPKSKSKSSKPKSSKKNSVGTTSEDFDPASIAQEIYDSGDVSKG